jgi:uncharacterized membrane protein
VEFERTGRAASERPQTLRAAHALCLEMTAAAVTLPIVMAMGGHGFWQAPTIDLALAPHCAANACFFHIVCDRLRPVSRAPFRAGPAQQWNNAG